ncbi:MAG: homoserine kinase [Melioribacteraceae bacterium]
MKKIIVSAPATVSNVGPGFDIMGFALDVVSDVIELSISKNPGIKIKKITGDGGKLPYDPKLNIASVAIQSILDKYKIKAGLELKINKKIGIGSGLGSSGASAVASVYAINKLLDLSLSKKELLIHALAGEILSSGSFHADNVAPCLYGGFVIARGNSPIEILQIDYPKKLFCSLVYPDIEIKTSEARKILPKNIPLGLGVEQAANASFLIAGLITKNFKLISSSIKDVFAEPQRAKLIPCYDAVREAALKNGALNCNISGSGPTMFAFSDSLQRAELITKLMEIAVKSYRIKSKSYISKINQNGPVEVINEKSAQNEIKNSLLIKNKKNKSQENSAIIFGINAIHNEE